MTLILEAYEERELNQTKRLVYHAWYSALFQRSKKLPPLKRVMSQFEKKATRAKATPEQLLEVAKMITKALGGTVDIKE